MCLCEGRVEIEAPVVSVRAGGFLTLENAEGDRLVLTRPSRINVRAVARVTGAAVPAGRVRVWADSGEDGEGVAIFAPPEGAPVLEVPLTDGEAIADGLVAGAYRVLVEAPGFLTASRALGVMPSSASAAGDKRRVVAALRATYKRWGGRERRWGGRLERSAERRSSRAALAGRCREGWNVSPSDVSPRRRGAAARAVS